MQFYFSKAFVFASAILLATTDAGAQWYDNYQDLTSIYSKLDDFQASRPDLVSSFSIGNSYEGREIRGIRISGTGGTKTNRPAVLINGTQHAREWIDPMTNMYAAEQLLEQYDTNSDLREMLDEVDFYVIPVVNPDGYEYTWASPSNRFWRKNRRPNGNGSFGVDLNRNWDFGWGLDSGSSSNSFSDIYRGTEPFSEPETQAMRDFYYSNPNIVSNIDFHAFTQLILSPNGYSSIVEPADGELMMTIAEEMADSIQNVHGKTYVPGPASDLYLASGISIDWTYGSENVYSYTIELRPAGPLTLPSFDLPIDQILPTAEEAFAAVLDLGAVTAALNRGDFNYDQQYSLDDLDDLTSGVVFGTSKAEYDVNGDAAIDTDDVLAWLENAGEENLPSGNVYLPGDANLDGIVDALDLGIWNANQLAMTTDWSRGDFNTDGVVDGDDYAIWLSNTASVPEPTTLLLLLAGLSVSNFRRSTRSQTHLLQHQSKPHP